MKKVLFILITCIALHASAQVKQAVTKSSVSYQIKNMGINTEGTFSGLQADIKFDPANLAGSSIEASVESATINSNNNMRDTHLKDPDYFDPAKYPHITMKSVSFKHGSRNNYTGIFNVTIKDKTKTVTVPFTYDESGQTGHFKGSFKINRLDFGIGDSSMILANEATILLDIETTK